MSKRMIDSELIGVLDGSEILLDSLSDANMRLCKMLDDDGNQLGWVMIKDSTRLGNTLPWYGYIKTGNSRHYDPGYFYRNYLSGPEPSIAKFNSDGDIVFPDSYYGSKDSFKPYMIIKKEDLSALHLNTCEWHSVKFTLTKSGSTAEEIFYYTFFLPRMGDYSPISLKTAADLGKWGEGDYYLDSAGTRLQLARTPSGTYQASWTASDGTFRTIKAFNEYRSGFLG